jgi:hypothetical protein
MLGEHPTTSATPQPFIYAFFAVLGLELYLEPHHQPFSVMGFFEIGSHELLAQIGFEP